MDTMSEKPITEVPNNVVSIASRQRLKEARDIEQALTIASINHLQTARENKLRAMLLKEIPQWQKIRNEDRRGQAYCPKDMGLSFEQFIETAEALVREWGAKDLYCTRREDGTVNIRITTADFEKVRDKIKDFVAEQGNGR